MLKNRGSTRTSTAIAIVPAQLAHLSGAWNLGGSTFRGDIHGCEKPLKSQGRERNANFRCPTNGQYATFNVIKFEQYVKDAETIGSYYSLAIQRSSKVSWLDLLFSGYAMALGYRLNCASFLGRILSVSAFRMFQFQVRSTQWMLPAYSTFILALQFREC